MQTATHTSVGQKLTLLFALVFLIFMSICFGMLLVSAPIPTDCSAARASEEVK
jgi:hypothetical protein